MRPTRHTQPYRKGPRAPTDALQAMQRGRTAGGYNPADITRMGQQKARKTAQSARLPRPQRLPRPPR